MKTSIVIPNWNGRGLLEKNLPAVLEMGSDEVIVVEDGSTDGSLEFVEEKYPEVRVIEHKVNQGFIKSVNDGFEKAIGDIVLLLNTDVTPQLGLKEVVVQHFKKDKELFAVSFNEESEWGSVKGVFYKGLVEHRPGTKPRHPVESFWASGGSAAYDRRKWLELGGMRAIYSPFYWEDLDIGYRAWKAGWRILWDYNARALHQHGATIKKKFSASKIDRTVKRNQILFFWTNITSVRMWLAHLLWLPIRMLFYGYFVPVILATLRMPQVIVLRTRCVAAKLEDEEILAKFKS